MRIGVVPLDERPVNVRYPAAIARIAGGELVLPPPEALGTRREPGRHDRLAAWLGEIAPSLDVLIVSVEQLGYGGLIALRTTSDPLATVLARLDRLRSIKTSLAAPLLFGFNLITRISNGRDGVEEPPYWPEIGPKLYRLSRLMDRPGGEEGSGEEEAALRARLPPEAVRDWLDRRERNHAVNLAAIDAVAAGVLDLLVLSSDDTSPVGLPSQEKRALAERAQRLGLGGRLLMYPGADEVGCALVARAMNVVLGRRPRFAPRFAVPGGGEVTAAFEDGPVRVTIERQVDAVGGALASDEDETATWLGVNPPVPGRVEWPVDGDGSEDEARTARLGTLIADAAQRLSDGRSVAIADVAYANGTDPALMSLLRSRSWLPSMAAFGGWNTAGNTIGTVVAQASAQATATTGPALQTHERFLLHRFVEDWGYQQRLRRELRDWLQATSGRTEPDSAQIDAVTTWLEPRLNAAIADLDAFAGRYRIVPGSVRLPWGRTFEVDFDLEATGDPSVEPAASPSVTETGRVSVPRG